MTETKPVIDQMMDALRPFAGQGPQHFGFWATLSKFGFNRGNHRHQAAVKSLKTKGILRVEPNHFEVLISPASLEQISAPGGSESPLVDAIALGRELVNRALAQAERVGALERENQMLQENVKELKQQIDTLRRNGNVLLTVPSELFPPR